MISHEGTCFALPGLFYRLAIGVLAAGGFLPPQGLLVARALGGDRKELDQRPGLLGRDCHGSGISDHSEQQEQHRVLQESWIANLLPSADFSMCMQASRSVAQWLFLVPARRSEEGQLSRQGRAVQQAKKSVRGRQAPCLVLYWTYSFAEWPA